MACIDPTGGTYSAAIVHKAKASAGNEKYQAQRKLLLQSDIILLAGRHKRMISTFAWVASLARA